ncbi:MAG: hypothetical protein EoVTN8_393 [Fluviibacter phosphoraccumulans EoVTN8]
MTLSDFAKFSTLIALSTLLTSPVNAVVLLITRQLSILSIYGVGSHVFQYYKCKLKAVVIVYSIIIATALPFSKSVSSFFNLESGELVVLLAAIATFNAVSMVNGGAIHGIHKFYTYAFLNVLNPIVKIALCALFLLLGFGLYGAVFGVLISSVVLAVCGYFLIANSISPLGNNTSDFRHAANNSQFIPLLIATLSLAAMTQIDVAIVNMTFSGNEAGKFAAAATLGKAVLYLPGGIVAAIFPLVSRLSTKSNSGTRIFLYSSGGVVLQSLLCVAIFFFYGDFIVSVLFGSSYAETSEVLWIYALALVPMAVIILSENFLIAQGSVVFSWIFLIAAPIQVLLLFEFGKSIRDVVYIIGLCNTALLIIGFAIMVRIYRVRLNDN